MVTQGLLVRLEAQNGRDDEFETFLRSAVPLVRAEPGTGAWFAVRFGRSEYGIFAVFPDDAGRQAHLAGAVPAALHKEGGRLLVSEPKIDRLRVLASKLPAAAPPTGSITRGLLLTFRAKQGHEAQVEDFLCEADSLVEREPGTIAWFALQLDSGEYGIFDVFPDNGARFTHLTGQVPRELTKHALALLGGLPDLHMLHVVAANFASAPAVAAA